MQTIPSASAYSTGDIERILLEIVRKQARNEGADWSLTTTMEEAQIDSFDLVELVFEVEDRFGVEVSFNANERPIGEMTFGDVIALIRGALASKEKAA
ncbi:hypothetical protein M446_3760 [Methylobacterium sp. 4-46]|uniref:acyl carrier protein n=1 Tax=unclassified Methylobacterium TaxID=2615210 RepID=UPI000165C915|nr:MULTISPECIES: acyl carrier protein [Methylobacterium]ACA18140.1 hypothetical protein M446_3760 [Methylobacterium sp. 4-46]WFT77437.1 acyl carrier protein [Methylobacterium nodulans]